MKNIIKMGIVFILLNSVIFGFTLKEIEKYEDYFIKTEKEIKEDIAKIEKESLKENNSEMLLSILYNILFLKNEKEKIYSEKALKYIEKAEKNNLDSMRIVLYKGVSYVNFGKADLNPERKIKFIKEGFKLFEQAKEKAKLDNDPYYWRVIYMKIKTYITLPSIFNKKGEVKKEIEFIEMYNKNTGLIEEIIIKEINELKKKEMD